MHKQHRKAYIPTKHFILYGPPSSGKGYSGSPIIKDNSVHPIITGDMIRTRMEKDGAFKNNWGKKVSDGYFVEDAVLDPMVKARYMRGAIENKNLRLWDGWHRTPEQVQSFDTHYNCEGDEVFVVYINASKSTCEGRNHHRNRIANRADGGSFNTRWSLYEKHTPSVLNAMRDCGIEVFGINGDNDLDTIAHMVWSEWCRFTGTNKPMPEIKRREIPAKKPAENPGSSRIPLGVLAAA